MIRCAVLIIGSLLWDNGRREAWRQSRLRVGDALPVEVPIRYGRRSRSRGDTFTMTLDANGACGLGLLVPCLASAQDVAALVAEAAALWAAENRRAQDNAISANWGCVGAMFRRDATSEDRIAAWTGHFRRHARPTPPVDGDGLLDLRWPLGAHDGKPVDAHVILAAAAAAAPSLPSATEIADAWVDQNDGHERYFLENVRHGIRTPDDHAIWARVAERAPSWLGAPEHREAIELLRSEARRPA